MGDRGNIVLHDKGAKIYLYTHWSGSNIQEVLKQALIKGRSRWGDPDYLHRVIFQELIGKNTDVTGFGLSTRLGDNEHPLLNVDAHVQGGRVWEEGCEACSFQSYIGEDAPSDTKGDVQKWERVRAELPKKASCKTCYGWGMWADGTAPMGPCDGADGMPTSACPECKKNPNPMRKK